jgi:hypothetical protein
MSFQLRNELWFGALAGEATKAVRRYTIKIIKGSAPFTASALSALRQHIGVQQPERSRSQAAKAMNEHATTPHGHAIIRWATSPFRQEEYL